MPGIAVIIGQAPSEENARDLLAMVRSMEHEPFYTSGTYMNGEVGVYIGWTCLKGSFSDCLPSSNENKDLMLFFYGENFIDKDVIDGLRLRGHAVEESKASILLHLFEEKGYEVFKWLNGWFHGVLIDLKQKEILLFNDRYGMQRLYYFEEKDSLLFASEAKAILKVRKQLRSLDDRSVGEYLTCDFVLQNRTLFPKVFTLPEASLWSFRNGRLVKRDFYFKAKEWENQTALNPDELFSKLVELFPRVMARQVQSNLTIGISLSGGLDTRLMMAYLDNRNLRYPCYAFGGMYRESFDVKLARRVAARCDQSYQTIQLGREFLTSFPNLAERTVYLSDGCLSACGAYELYLNKLARQVAEVRLTGNYGSEVFRSMRAVKAVRPRKVLIRDDFQKYVQDAVDTFEEVSKTHKLSFSVFRQAPWHGYGRLSVEQSQVVLRTPFMDNDLVALMYRAPEGVRSSSQLEWRLIEHGNPDLISIPTDMGLRGRWGGVSSYWAQLIAYFLLKADYYYKSGMPQVMERIHYLLRPLQPEKLIIGRDRFYHFRIWFRNELTAYVKEILLDRKTSQRPYLNGSFLEPMVLRHIKGDRNYTSEIEKVLTMELLYRLFID